KILCTDFFLFLRCEYLWLSFEHFSSFRRLADRGRHKKSAALLSAKRLIGFYWFELTVPFSERSSRQCFLLHHPLWKSPVPAYDIWQAAKAVRSAAALRR